MCCRFRLSTVLPRPRFPSVSEMIEYRYSRPVRLLDLPILGLHFYLTGETFASCRHRSKSSLSIPFDVCIVAFSEAACDMGLTVQTAFVLLSYSAAAAVCSFCHNPRYLSCSTVCLFLFRAFEHRVLYVGSRFSSSFSLGDNIAHTYLSTRTVSRSRRRSSRRLCAAIFT